MEPAHLSNGRLHSHYFLFRSRSPLRLKLLYSVCVCDLDLLHLIIISHLFNVCSSAQIRYIGVCIIILHDANISIDTILRLQSNQHIWWWSCGCDCVVKMNLIFVFHCAHILYQILLRVLYMDSYAESQANTMRSEINHNRTMQMAHGKRNVSIAVTENVLWNYARRN